MTSRTILALSLSLLLSACASSGPVVPKEAELRTTVVHVEGMT